jgi:hypothetical protein
MLPLASRVTAAVNGEHGLLLLERLVALDQVLGDRVRKLMAEDERQLIWTSPSAGQVVHQAGCEVDAAVRQRRRVGVLILVEEGPVVEGRSLRHVTETVDNPLDFESAQPLRWAHRRGPRSLELLRLELADAALDFQGSGRFIRERSLSDGVLRRCAPRERQRRYQIPSGGSSPCATEFQHQ